MRTSAPRSGPITGNTGVRTTRQPAPRSGATRPVVGAQPLRTSTRIAKRSLDVVVAIVALVVCAPVLLVAVIAIRVESPGSPLFGQVRLGRGGRPFRVLKLRSMRCDGDESEHAEYLSDLIHGRAAPHDGVFKLTKDDRRTNVGKFLRRTSIDELPQLFNVLRGDMSLVGPRPSTPEEASLWDERTWGRLGVKPGMTGLWQVSGRSRLTFEAMVDLDLDYVSRPTVWRDVWILLRTPFATLRGETA
jgi:lipopolysaccharide/colanic/teichoic acid biosynthesis glycosyltransferase